MKKTTVRKDKYTSRGYITKEQEKLSIAIKALKHANKILNSIEKFGKYDMKIGCTGLCITVTKNSSNHLSLLTKRQQLIEEITSIQVVSQNRGISLSPESTNIS